MDYSHFRWVQVYLWALIHSQEGRWRGARGKMERPAARRGVKVAKVY